MRLEVTSGVENIVLQAL